MTAKIQFPVVAHHRAIVNAPMRDDDVLRSLFAGFDLVEPITETNSSTSEKYVSFSISVRLRDADEMSRFDERLKLIPGLKMVL